MIWNEFFFYQFFKKNPLNSIQMFACRLSLVIFTVEPNRLVWCIIYSFLFLMQNEQIHSTDNFRRIFWQFVDDSVTFFCIDIFGCSRFDLCLSEFDLIWFDLSWSSPLNSTQICRWKCLNQNGIGKAKSIVCRKFWSKMHWIARLMLVRARWAT